MSSLEESIEANIKLSTNFDPDRQYMAIKELAETIEKDSDKIPPT